MKIFENLWNIWIDLFRKNEKKESVPKPEPISIIIEKPKPEPIPEPEKDYGNLINAMGKGQFIYYLDSLYNEEGGIEKTVARFKEWGLNHVWIRIVGKKGWSNTQTKQQARDFMQACLESKINVGAWGFIYDEDSQPDKYAHYVVQYVQELGITCFIHNAEFDHEDDSLIIELEHAHKYWNVIESEIPDICHGLSTYWNPNYHPNFPWKVYVDHINFIAPQIYHVKKDPIATIKKGIYLNSKFNLPIVVTGQAFWSELGLTEIEATKDFVIICNKWNIELNNFILRNDVSHINGTETDKIKAIEEGKGKPSKAPVIGVNWWHAGGSRTSAMNEEMEMNLIEFNPILNKPII